jgi:acyl-CoA oxidase
LLAYTYAFNYASLALVEMH